MKRLIMMMAITASSLLPVGAQAGCNSLVTSSKPDSALDDNGDGTVTDRETGLMWMLCSQGLSGTDCATGTASTFTWAAAQAAVQTANAGSGTNGYKDWRLPSVAELGSLTESACYNPAVNADYFPATPSSAFWSSSPSVTLDDSAWVVSFSEGMESVDSKDSLHYVRLVRE